MRCRVASAGMSCSITAVIKLRLIGSKLLPSLEYVQGALHKDTQESQLTPRSFRLLYPRFGGMMNPESSPTAMEATPITDDKLKNWLIKNPSVHGIAQFTRVMV